MRFHLLILATLLASSCTQQLQNADFVLPRPQKAEVLPGKGVKASAAIANIRCEISRDGVPESGQGYVLEITDTCTLIKSRSDTGLFYGRQSLEQIVTDAQEYGRKIQPIRITDYPDIAFRGIHIGYWFQIDDKEHLYRLVDKLAQYKINAFFFETEDKLKFDSHPELATSLALSKDEMKALCEYAHERYVEIDPLVQGLGHAFYILKHHPELREREEDLFVCCPSNPDGYKLLFDLYDEAIEAMPYCKYVHVGGDEVEGIGICDRCRKTGKTSPELYREWTRKVTDHIKSKGRIPVLWDDVLYRGLNSGFAEGCEYVRWIYEETDTPETREKLEWCRDNGINLLAASAADNGAQKYMPRQNSRLPYIAEFSRLAKEYGLDGIFSTFWQDKGAMTEFAIRGFIGQGEYGWNTDGRSFDEFSDAHSRREFGFFPKDSLMAFLPNLEKSMDFLDTAFVYVNGKRKTVIELPDSRFPGKWSGKHATRLELARYWNAKYPEMESILDMAIKKATRNDYTLRMYRENNRHRHFDEQLLLALERYDKSGGQKEREKALDDILSVCDGFEPMCRQLESVFSESCQLDMPDDYILIKWGVLPSLSKDFSWNYHYEIPMVENVRKWAREQQYADFKMVLRCWDSTFIDRDLAKRTLAQLKRYPVFDEMWMFLPDTTLAKDASEFAQKLSGMGISPCYEQITLGHGDSSERSNLSFLYGNYDLGITVPPFSRHMTGPDGTECQTSPCPRDEKRLQHLADFNSLYAGLLKPERIMIDDDLRLYNHRPIDAACFCNSCIEEFSRKNGCKWTRESLVRALGDPRNGSLRTEWINFGKESLGHIAGSIGRAVKAASPGTDVGLENGCNTMVPVTGIHLRPVFDSLYASTGVQPSYRPGAGFYRDYEPRGMIDKANDLARQIRLLPEYVKAIPAEIEGYHHTASGKSPHSLEVESLLYLAMGCTQLSYAIISSSDEPIEWYADNYFKVLLPIKEYLKEYATFNSGTEPGGLDEFISPDWYERTEKLFERAAPDTYIARLQALGIPFTPGGHYACAHMMCEREFKLCSKTDLDRFLREGLLLDEAAFGLMDKSSLVQTADLEGTRFVKTFTTAEGGRLAVLPTFKPTNINISRREELFKIADWVSFGKLPVIAKTMAQVMFVPRVEANGRLRSVVALNCTISDYGPINIILRGCTEAKSFVWKVPGKADRKLDFSLEEDGVSVTIPGIDDWCAGWIAINY